MPPARKFRLQKITLRSFQRITTSGSYIPEIDGLRFIAIISVMWIHCYGEVLNRLALGTALSRVAASPIVMEGPQGFLRLLGHGGYGVNVFLRSADSFWHCHLPSSIYRVAALSNSALTFCAGSRGSSLLTYLRF
jgi:hypothetical protein